MNDRNEFRDGKHLSQRVRVCSAVLEKVDEIAQKTRRPYSEIVSELCRYALGHVTLKPTTMLYDIEFDDGSGGTTSELRHINGRTDER